MPHCDACQPTEVWATKKMLVLSSDPSVTVWVCNECATKFAQSDNCADYVIDTEETIERLWQEEEDRRDTEFYSNYPDHEFVPDVHLHKCPCCNEYFDCDGEECTAPSEYECDTCIEHETICYSNVSNP